MRHFGGVAWLQWGSNRGFLCVLCDAARSSLPGRCCVHAKQATTPHLLPHGRFGLQFVPCRLPSPPTLTDPDGLLAGWWGRPQTRRASTTRTSSRHTSTSSTPRASSSWTTTSTDTAPPRAPPFSLADCAPPALRPPWWPPALRGPALRLPPCGARSPLAATLTRAAGGALGRRPYKLAATRKNFNPATVKDGLHLSYKTIGDKLQSAGYSVRPHHFAALRHKTAQLTAATTLARRPTNSASGTSAIHPCPPSPTSSRPLRLRRC